MKKIIKWFYIILKKISYKIENGINFKYGKKLVFLSGFNLIMSKNAKVKIGDYCFFNYNCSIAALDEIEIGDNCLFGENVKIYDHNHKFRNKDILIKNQGYKKRKIIIGDNCWIGSNVMILNNVKIGDNVVIGANCLIYNDIPSNTIVKLNQKLEYEEF